MRNIFFYFFAFVLALNAFVKSGWAQTTELYIGSGSSLYIKSGESVTASGLTLQPSVDFELTKSLYKQTTITNTASGTYLPIVYRFDATTNSFSGQIMISYAGSGTASEADYKLQYYNGSIWSRDAGSTVDLTNDVVTSSSLSSVSLNEFTISDMMTTLPLTWRSFTAEKRGGAVFLQWSTASEQNTKDFVIFYSSNGIGWSNLGTVPAAGNSHDVRSYSFIHDNPSKGNGHNYYRIRQQDENGHTSYSSIVSLVFDATVPQLQLYPNPAHHFINVYLAENQTLELINMLGVRVWMGNLPAGNSQIRISHLSKGMYFLKSKKNQYPIVIH